MRNKGLPFILGCTEREDGVDDPNEVARGIRISLLAEDHKGDYQGAICSGGLTTIDGNLRGVAIGAINVITESQSGTMIGAVNYSHTNYNLLLQIGLVNKVSEFDPKGAAIQIGLYNRIGEQTIPLVNVRGLVDWCRRKK